MKSLDIKNINYNSVNPFRLNIRYVEIDSNSPENVYDSHIHTECEIYINISGDVSFMVEDHIYPIVPGSIIITRPYEYHHCLYHGNSIHKHFWILFSAEQNEHLFERFFKRSIGCDNLLTVPPERLQDLCSLCHKIYNGAVSESEKLYLFFKLIHVLNTADIPDVMAENFPEDISTAISYITSNLSDPITVKEIASASHVSVNTLERHFATYMHISPSAFIRKKRLANAAEKLYNGFSVLDACQSSGFSDYSNFISLFKKTYGVTPLKYKNQAILHSAQKKN